MPHSIEGLPYGLKITPFNWPESMTGRRPGDEEFDKPNLPTERDLSEMLLVHPDDTPYSVADFAAHPLLMAPLYLASTGTVYFERRVPEDLHALLRVLAIRGDTKEYAAFVYRAHYPVIQRYLVQLKLVTFMALETVYGVKDVPLPPKQDMTLAEAMVGFVEDQAEAWLEPGRVFSSRLSGAAGGDGDYDKEDLAFGLHVEKPFWGVYRIWSRPWLVSK